MLVAVRTKDVPAGTDIIGDLSLGYVVMAHLRFILIAKRMQKQQDNNPSQYAFTSRRAHRRNGKISS